MALMVLDPSTSQHIHAQTQLAGQALGLLVQVHVVGRAPVAPHQQLAAAGAGTRAAVVQAQEHVLERACGTMGRYGTAGCGAGAWVSTVLVGNGRIG